MGVITSIFWNIFYEMKNFLRDKSLENDTFWARIASPLRSKTDCRGGGGGNGVGDGQFCIL